MNVISLCHDPSCMPPAEEASHQCPVTVTYWILQPHPQPSSTPNWQRNAEDPRFVSRAAWHAAAAANTLHPKLPTRVAGLLRFPIHFPPAGPVLHSARRVNTLGTDVLAAAASDTNFWNGLSGCHGRNGSASWFVAQMFKDSPERADGRDWAFPAAAPLVRPSHLVLPPCSQPAPDR